MVKEPWFLACSAYFLIQIRTTCVGMTPPTVDWVLSHISHPSRQFPTDTSNHANLMEEISQLRLRLPK